MLNWELMGIMDFYCCILFDLNYELICEILGFVYCLLFYYSGGNDVFDFIKYGLKFLK